MNKSRSYAAIVALALLGLMIAPFESSALDARRLLTTELYVIGVENVPDGGVRYRAEVRVDLPESEKASAVLEVTHSDGTREVFNYPDVAGNFRDTAEGETARDYPYSTFKFTVVVGSTSHTVSLDVLVRPGESKSAVLEVELD